MHHSRYAWAECQKHEAQNQRELTLYEINTISIWYDPTVSFTFLIVDLFSDLSAEKCRKMYKKVSSIWLSKLKYWVKYCDGLSNSYLLTPCRFSLLYLLMWEEFDTSNFDCWIIRNFWGIVYTQRGCIKAIMTPHDVITKGQFSSVRSKSELKMCFSSWDLPPRRVCC